MFFTAGDLINRLLTFDGHLCVLYVVCAEMFSSAKMPRSTAAAGVDLVPSP